MSARRFTNVKALVGLNRALSCRFFGAFAAELKQKGIVLPSTELPDHEYFEGLTNAFCSLDRMPPLMIEALDMILEMANESGIDRLRKGLGLTHPLVSGWEKKSSDLDIVMQVWLAEKELLVAKHAEHQLVMLTSYQYCGSTVAPADRLPFKEPTPEVIAVAVKDLDTWCEKHNRGADTAAIVMKPLDGELYFLIQHGGTYARTAKLDKRRLEILHFTPGKHDVVVYSLARDEIRIHSSGTAERKFYRELFGKCLWGNPNQFGVDRSFTLKPLRDDVEKALSTDDLRGIEYIKLKKLEVAYRGEFNDSTIKKSDDMVASAAERSKKNGTLIRAVPEHGELIAADFSVKFEGVKTPRPVSLRPGVNGLSVGREGDVRLILEWLSLRGFREVSEEEKRSATRRRAARRLPAPVTPDEEPAESAVIPPIQVPAPSVSRNVVVS